MITGQEEKKWVVGEVGVQIIKLEAEREKNRVKAQWRKMEVGKRKWGKKRRKDSLCAR